MWLYKKVDARITIWVNRLLSRGGRLVLFKSMLESILVYWASIVVVPKGILTKIRIAGLEVFPLVKWSRVAAPKKFRRMGIK